ncbi:MAG: TIGR00282 family metallophosphoesterase [Candidatus Latescibacterota bacterium]|nr:MAG: TIGR00282 family metallophosphoesterase [Candidatus Latescibacterota bacterium]
MKIAFIGDVIGRGGRRTVANIIPRLKDQYEIHLIIANVENAAGGFGVTEKALDQLDLAGVDFFTSGNHIWDKKEGVRLLDARTNIIRPANYPGDAPGRGYRVIQVDGTSVAIFNIQGRVFMPPIDCPFRTIDKNLGQIGDGCPVKIVDMHAEATSEKVAMGWHLDGRASLVLGTHTHVATRDARVLPDGTGYVTDVGMTGSHDSVIGVNKKTIIKRFLEMRPARFETAGGDLRSDIVLADIDNSTGRTSAIEHIQMKMEE